VPPTRRFADNGFVTAVTDDSGVVLNVAGPATLVARLAQSGVAVGRPSPTEVAGWTCAAEAIELGQAVVWWPIIQGPPEAAHLALALRVAAAEGRAETERKRAQQTQFLVSLVCESMGTAGALLVNKAGDVLFATDIARRLLRLGRSEATSDLSVSLPYLWKRVRKILESPDGEGAISLSPPAVTMECSVQMRVVGGIAALVVRHETDRDRADIPRQPKARYRFVDLITRSATMQEALGVARAAAPTDTPVLLVGETGTGKELVAQALHNASHRRGGPFVAINCGALPAELIASELFGYESGAFTGARRGGAIGKFEEAGGGTLFLDEISEMPLEQQVKLLRVLEQREVSRLGGRGVIPVDIRIVAATNQDLLRLVQAGRFRSDLYYRLSVVEVHLPALRERPEDIPVLVGAFLEREALAAGRGAWRVSPELITLLQSHPWPGNVRELHNVVKRATLMAPAAELTPDQLPGHLLAALSQERAAAVPLQITNELDLIRQAVERAGGNVTKAARMLGISRTTIYRKLSTAELRID